ncbi:hypothetical protein [Alkalibacter saccharofermentans]|uniref:DUF3221 domain-containing protein n=1 Tax=Alkalibacter saccharofermentans DSM 14828 TaxID=1120975 RepID=A0A1M4TKG3_9FIRM|nr:hypothetical protein [Alkalibacter saccharofermentans]SHE44854.1 hypothetical protein SAMN02746064_00521 [Alkalibacter saccharofermentans DSM 14828]
MKSKYLIIAVFVLISVVIISSCGGTSDEERNIIEGIVLEAGENNFILETEENDLYSVFISEDTQFGEGVSRNIETGNAVSLRHDGKVAESWPMQIRAVEILKNQKIK